MKFRNIKFYIFILSLFFIFPMAAFADNTGDRQNFYVEKNYSLNDSTQASATLLKAPDMLYFYVENDWWNSKTEAQKNDISVALDKLGAEFNSKIYPKLTSTFGNEATPGVDKDRRITVLFYRTTNSVKGYVRNIDEYEKTVNPLSNQREMVYINADLITGSYIDEIMSHEFMHLITINQKELRIGTPEDTWLNEALSEYAVTYLGYNDKEDSYLNQRISAFLDKPYDSLTNWTGSQYDYGVVNAFINYLVDQYGLNILTDSLKSNKTGIQSLDEALAKNNHKETISDIFTDWTIASYVNDCTLGARYCYTDNNLKDLHIIPFGNFLPFSGESTLYLGQTLMNYSANWQKFSGGKGELKIDLSNPSGVNMTIFYVIKSATGETSIGTMKLTNQEGELVIPDMGQNVYSVTVIPSIHDDSISASDGKAYFYSITANTINNDGQSQNADTIKLPFSIDKPLSQMNREELLTVLLKVIIYLVVHGKTIF